MPRSPRRRRATTGSPISSRRAASCTWSLPATRGASWIGSIGWAWRLTSFAAPQVTALIAEMRRINPDLTNDEIRDIIARASTDTDATDREEGAGILDPDRALLLARLSLLPEVLPRFVA